MEARKITRLERPSPHKGRKKVNHVWRKNTFCNHYNKGGHKRATYWRLHSEQRLKNKGLVQEPIEKLVQQENQLKDDDPFTLMSERCFYYIW